MRRRWRSSSPRSRKSANASCSIRAVPRSASAFSSRTALQQAARDDEPAEPQRRRQRLAGRAGVDDALGLEALQRPDGRAVVAVLGVVVVLDRDRVPLAQPRAQRGTPLGRHQHPGRVLVGRGDHDGVRAAERVDHHAAVVDGHAAPARVPPARTIACCSRLLGSSIADAARRRAPRARGRRARGPASSRTSPRRGRRRRRRRGRGRGTRRARAAAASTPSGLAVPSSKSLIELTASRRERAHASRGNAETSGMLGRKSNRGGGSAAAAPSRRAPTTAAVSDTRGRAPWRSVR